MGLFGNSEKKLIERNQLVKDSILQKLNNTLADCTNADARRALDSIRRFLERQSASSEQEIITVDGQIMNHLDTAIAYIDKGRFSTALIELFDMEDKVIERKKYCNVGGRKSKKLEKKDRKVQKLLGAEQAKSKEKDLMDDVNDLDAELESRRKREEVLLRLQKEFPNDRSIAVQITRNTARHNAILQQFEVAGSGAIMKEQMEGAEEIVGYTNQVQAQVPSQAEADITLRNLEESKKTATQMAETNQKLAQALGTPASTVTASTIASAGTSYTTISGATMTTGTTIAGTTIAGTTIAGATAQTQFGGFDASLVGTAAMANQIRRAQQSMNSSIDKIQQKIDAANAERKDLETDLRYKIQELDRSAPSDKPAIQGEINRINSRRSSLKHAIDRYIAEQSQISDRLAMIDRLDTQQDIAAMNASIQQMTQGKFADFEGLATYLDEQIQQSNASLKSLSDAMTVANGTEINTMSSSAASAAYNDAVAVFDEHQNDLLRAELGMQPLAQ